MVSEPNVVVNLECDQHAGPVEFDAGHLAHRVARDFNGVVGSQPACVGEICGDTPALIEKWQVLVLQDVFMGLLKPLLFGFIIATIGCYYGMTARGGTQGVGRATTQAVVAASVLILVTDFFVTKLLISVLSYH